jgi:DNA-binding response OmpR family regulator
VRLLVAEDDAKLCDVLARGLEQAGYVLDAVHRGDEALDLLHYNDYAVAILDWRMPGLDGVEVIRRARRAGLRTPVLMLTARDTPADRIAGLDAGSDDYLIKPFEFAELLARLRALMRRQAQRDVPAVEFCALCVDPSRREATIAGDALPLTPTEFSVVEALARAAPNLISRRDLVRHVWPDAGAEVGANTVEVHVARLRAKLVRGGIGIEGVPRAGYRLVQR